MNANNFGRFLVDFSGEPFEVDKVVKILGTTVPEPGVESVEITFVGNDAEIAAKIKNIQLGDRASIFCHLEGDENKFEFIVENIELIEKN